MVQEVLRAIRIAHIRQRSKNRMCMYFAALCCFQSKRTFSGPLLAFFHARCNSNHRPAMDPSMNRRLNRSLGSDFHSGIVGVVEAVGPEVVVYCSSASGRHTIPFLVAIFTLF